MVSLPRTHPHDSCPTYQAFKFRNVTGLLIGRPEDPPGHALPASFDHTGIPTLPRVVDVVNYFSLLK